MSESPLANEPRVPAAGGPGTVRGSNAEPERTAGLAVEPFYFGESPRRLFGICHPPSGPRRDCGVVLCYPMGQEYIRSHRSFGQLSLRLAAAGFPVLRFDYYGCGDSEGGREEGTVRQWLGDISTAVGELRRRSGAPATCLVGLRFGAALAAMAGAERGDVTGLVLWDPVVDGAAHLRELAAATSTPGPSPAEGDGDGADELTEAMGFPLTETLLAGVRSTVLAEMTSKPARHALIIDSQEPPIGESLGRALQRLGTRVDQQHLASLPIWVDKNKALVPIRIVQSIVAWLSTTCA